MALAETRSELRGAIADALWANVSALDLADVCVDILQLAPPRDENDSPMASKRRYVEQRIRTKSVSELLDLAHKVIDEYGDEDLVATVARFGAKGVDGELKNLIFAADGPKPRIVLRDAINNVVEVVENGQFSLVYGRPLGTSGLTWRELIDWWVDRAVSTSRRPDHDLYQRLRKSLDNDVERRIFRTYCKRYRTHGFELPALIPQVYLHYDPYTRRELGDHAGALVRQRMDFLLLFPRHIRVVIELDGIHHYARTDGRADSARYAQMVSEDRRLRLAGYEVYRFGGSEFVDKAAGEAALDAFFDDLLEKHWS